MQILLPLPELETRVEDLSDESIETFGRRLAMWVLLETLAEAKGMREGDPEEARVWLDLEGREWLAELGLPRAREATMSQLLDINEDALARALTAYDPHQHCRNCAFLRVFDGRCECLHGSWVRMGMAGQYSHKTVYYGDSRYYCKEFEDR